MSVMIVSDTQVNTIATWIAHHCGNDQVRVAGTWHAARDCRDGIARELHAWNVAAWNARYNEAEDPAQFTPRAVDAAKHLQPGQVFQLLASLEYNSDEAPGWQTGAGRQLHDCLLRCLARQLRGATGAPRTVDTAADVQAIATPAAQRVHLAAA